MSTTVSLASTASADVDITTSTTARFVPAVGRLLMSTIFLASSLSKLAAPAATIGYIGSAGLPLRSRRSLCPSR